MNKNLLLASGLIAVAVIIYMRKNKKPVEVTVIAPVKDETSNACGMCGANGENWN